MKFDANGQPANNYNPGPFTEAGIDVDKVKLTHDTLRIQGRRMALIFTDGIPERVSLASIHIEIQSPSDGDFDKALTAIFAPDLDALVPNMPFYWQDFAQKHLLTTKVQGISSQPTAKTARADDPTSSSGDKPFHLGGRVLKPIVLHQEEPQFSKAARALKYSGNVEVYLWVLQDGSPSHLSIVKPAGMGLDEQALLAASRYKFKPATKDGKPVTVDLYVDVNFQIR
jgi:TonB family protein